MGDYIIAPDGELMHYGVRGMKWGVRRARKKLSKATSNEEREKAVTSLNKHKEKATAKVKKLEKSHVQLEKDVNRHIQKTDIQATKLKREATRTRSKAYGRFTSQKKAAKRIYQADKLDARAEELKARSESAKARLAKNEKMQELFRKGIDEIDNALVTAGRNRLKRKAG